MANSASTLQIALAVFLMGDATASAKAGQQTPNGYYNVERMLKGVLTKKGDVLLCGTCMDARGIGDAEIVAGDSRRGGAQTTQENTMRLNNVNLQGMMTFMEQAKQDPSVLKKQKRVEGAWDFQEGHPQFKATLAYPGGERTLEADLAPFMGGAGLAPDPIQYCLYGLAACFAGTFMSLAAADGVTLKSLRVVAENQVNLTRPMGLGDNPVVEQVSLKLVVDTDASDRALGDLERMARERCPGIYCLTQPIPLETAVVRSAG